METATVGRYLVGTQQRYERGTWRSEFFVGNEDTVPDSANALYREGNCGPPFDSPEQAAAAALGRGVEFALLLGDPRLIALLTLYPETG
ncbi:hypothetical protein [Paraburkholderia aromaticivorans]|uniref:hypothetical protein n=1 Tax=Paraburkholderia aromaticivorans TaxID=2026199 RepID=UPI0038BA6F34